MRVRHRWLVSSVVAGLGLGLAVAALVWVTPRANAAPPAQGTGPGVSNETCLDCHARPGQVKTLPSGEPLYLSIDPAGYAASVHGSGGYACVQCHTDVREFPHPELAAQDLRQVARELSTSCRACHIDKHELVQDSVHQRALAAGNENAAVCADCHNPHYQTRFTEPATRAVVPEARVRIPQTCARCHSAIYDQYKQSVHGAALIGQGNPDVPTCIDCHGVHNIQDPTTESFRLDSPQLCAKCHTDAARMDKYGLSTQVLTTYLADFHGTTVTLFEKTTPDQQTNKPVCFDCHGIHNISSAGDPQKGLRVKQNLLATCRQCHPDATANFPDAWLSHYIPSAEKNPLVYYVNVFYAILIPTLIGGMFVFVVSDGGRRLLNRRRKGTA